MLLPRGRRHHPQVAPVTWRWRVEDHSPEPDKGLAGGAVDETFQKYSHLYTGSHVKFAVMWRPFLFGKCRYLPMTRMLSAQCPECGNAAHGCHDCSVYRMSRIDKTRPSLGVLHRSAASEAREADLPAPSCRWYRTVVSAPSAVAAIFDVSVPCRYCQPNSGPGAGRRGCVRLPDLPSALPASGAQRRESGGSPKAAYSSRFSLSVRRAHPHSGVRWRGKLLGPRRVVAELRTP